MAKILYFNSLALDFHMDEASRTFRGREGEDTLPGRSLKKRRKTATMMLWDVSFVGGGGEPLEKDWAVGSSDASFALSL